MSIETEEKRIELLEKELALQKEILEVKRQILECEEKLRATRAINPPCRIDYWPYYEPYEHWSDGASDSPLPPQNVTIC